MYNYKKIKEILIKNLNDDNLDYEQAIEELMIEFNREKSYFYEYTYYDDISYMYNENDI